MEVIGKDGSGRGSHGSIHSVVASGCKYFLTRTTLNGFKVSEDEENGLQVSLKMDLPVFFQIHVGRHQWRIHPPIFKSSELSISLALSCYFFTFYSMPSSLRIQIDHCSRVKQTFGKELYFKNYRSHFTWSM